MGTQSIAGLLAVTLGIVTITGTVELWMVYVIAAGFGAVTAVDNPSRQTFVMEMVGPADVSNAVTLNSVVVNAARVIGPAIGGVLIATVGIGQCFVVNAVSYLAVVIALVLDPHRRTPPLRPQGPCATPTARRLPLRVEHHDAANDARHARRHRHPRPTSSRRRCHCSPSSPSEPGRVGSR